MTSALVQALQAGDLASAVRILDAAVAGEEAKMKKASSSASSAGDDQKTNGAPSTSPSSSSSSTSTSSSLRLANALANRAMCHERLGMMRRALKDCDAALRCDPAHAAARRLRPRLLRSLGRPEDEARAALRASLDGENGELAFSADLGVALEAAEALRGGGGERGGGATVQAAVAAASEPPSLEEAPAAAPSPVPAPPSPPPAPASAPAPATALAAKKKIEKKEEERAAVAAPAAASSPPPPSPPPPPKPAPPAPRALAPRPPTPPTPSSRPASTPIPAATTAVDVERAKAAAARAAAAAARASRPGGAGMRSSSAAAQQLAPAIAAAAGLARDAAVAAASQSSSSSPSSSSSSSLSPAQRLLARAALGQRVTDLTSAAVEAINADELGSALAILDALIEGPVAQLALPLAAGTAGASAAATPSSASALAIAATGARVARGTARALMRDVRGAIDDFTAAIRLAPGYADSWKRRAQARAALASGIRLSGSGGREGGERGENNETGDGASANSAEERELLLDGALSDLAQAARLLPRGPARADVLGERAAIHRRRRDLRRAASDLQRAVDEADDAVAVVALHPNGPRRRREGPAVDSSGYGGEPLDPVVHARLWSSLGLARVGLGEIDEGVAAYERALALLLLLGGGGGGGGDGDESGEKGKEKKRTLSLAEQRDAAEVAMARAEILSHLMHAHKEAANPQECKRAYARYLRAATGQVPAAMTPGGTGAGPSPSTTRLFAQMLAGCGDLSAAIQEMEVSLGYRSAALSSTGKAASAGDGAAAAGSGSSSSSCSSSSSSSPKKGSSSAAADAASQTPATARRPVELRPAARAESLVTLGGFYHAAGRFGAAASAYDEAARCAELALKEKKKDDSGGGGGSASEEEDEDGGEDAEEAGRASSKSSNKAARVASALAFYQKETLLWLAEHLDDPPATETCLDADLSPLFKEGWCKKERPDAALLAARREQTMRPDLFVPPSQRKKRKQKGEEEEEEEEKQDDDNKDGGAAGALSSFLSTPLIVPVRGGKAGTSGRGRSSSSSSAASVTPEPGTPAAAAAFLAGRVDIPFPVTPDVISASKLDSLLRAADAVGALTQYRQRGFLPNARTRRAAGLAAIETAQLLRRVAAAARGGSGFSSSPSSSSSSSSNELVILPRGASHPSGAPRACGWRDLADVAARWRQLAEPADQALWVDRLSTQEFEAGFGSHTPIFSGQTACVRYASNAARALRLFAECAALVGGVKDAAGEEVACPKGSARAAAIAAARSPRELLDACGCDAWVAVPIEAVKTGAAASKKKKGGSGGEEGSSQQQGKPTTLDGTRLTVTVVPGVPDGVELSIRTPVTPARWRAFAAELDAHFADLQQALARRDAPASRAAGARLAYYWFNFMPLARGSASVGLTMLLAVGLACGLPATSGAPEGRQVDWEAILCRTPAGFSRVVVPWLWPESGGGSGSGGGGSGSGGGGSGSGGGGSGSGGGGSGGSVAGGEGAKASSGDGASASSASASPAAPSSFDPDSLPQVSTVLRSFRQRIAALNRGIVP